MIGGQTASYQGYEVALFPLSYINISQTSGPSSFSHCCGRPCDYVGIYSNFPIYAPFSCHLCYSDNVGNTRAYSSNAPVWTPSGLSYVTVSFTHDNNPPSATSFSQGQLIAHTGTAGFVTGEHTHIDQSLQGNARLVSYGITCSGGNLCYALSGSTDPNAVFYLTGSETIINTRGYNFQTWNNIDPPVPPGPPEPPEPPEPIKTFKWWMSKRIIERRKHGL